MPQTIVQDPDLGKLILAKTKAAKGISIRVTNVGVRISFPPIVPVTEVLVYARSKREWIKNAQTKLLNIPVQQKKIIVDGVQTKYHTLRIQPEATNKVRISVITPIANIYYPENLSINDIYVQTNLQKALEYVWKIEAFAHLPQKLKQLADQHNLSVQKISIKNIKGYWGKCIGPRVPAQHPNNHIILNIHLMHIPDHLIDYVLLHELCHIVHKNHGPQFWDALNKLTQGMARKLDTELKKYSTSNNILKEF